MPSPKILLVISVNVIKHQPENCDMIQGGIIIQSFVFSFFFSRCRCQVGDTVLNMIINEKIGRC